MLAADKITSFANKLDFESHNKIMTYYGKDKSGRYFFCYIICEYIGFKKMHNDYLNKIADKPESYGEIIYIDFISRPDKKALEFLQTYLASNN